MPTTPIIDTHVHLWDPRRLRYPWIDGNAVLDRPYLLDEYAKATAGIDVEAMVFLQCDAMPSQFLEEAQLVTELAAAEPKLKAMVAFAPLEKGEAARADIEALLKYPTLRGIRRLIQSEPDFEFCLQPDFIAGVRLLKDYGLTFDICINHRHMANTLAFARQIDDVPMVLDHIGKPAIKAGIVEPWSDQMHELAKLPNLVCKISGVATEAHHSHWTEDELRRYVTIAIEAFGFDRILFGSDWPVALLAIAYPRWVDILDHVLEGTTAEEKEKFWRCNALRFYRIGRPLTANALA